LTRAVAWLIPRLGILVVAAWIAATVATVHYLPTISQPAGSQFGGLVAGGAGAIEAQRREARDFGSSLLTRVVVVQHADGPLGAAQLRRTATAAIAVDRRHERGRIAFAAPLVSRNRDATITYLYFRPTASSDQQLAAAQRYARSLDPPGLRGGAVLARDSEFHEITKALPRVTLATVGLIVLILLLRFRALGPPLVGLVAAGIAYVISVRLLAWVGLHEHKQVPKEVEPILIALLLGLMTDYSVFFLASARRHLADGVPRFRAAEHALRENLPIILTAGLIVALGSLTLVVGKLEVFRSFGPGMALTVLVTIAVAVTFIPAVLALLGPLVFWPSLEPRERATRERLWRFVTARPVSGVVVVLVAAGLLVLCAGLADLRLGFTIVRGLPAHSEAKKAQIAAQAAFPAGIVAPTEVLVEGAHERRQLVALQREIARQPGVARVIGPATIPKRFPVFANRRAARYAVVLREEALDAKAISTFRHLRHRMPELLGKARLGHARVDYAGDTALAAETVRAVRSDGYRIGIAVLLVNLVLLGLFLRRVWAPVYLLAASALALAASLGVTTWVMEHVLGHDDVTYYVPFAACVLLLSLGSDYNVFVVGRIWQVARTRPLRDAIAEVAPRASATIATAGVTLAGSFGLLALVPIRPMRELAFVMALGILLDTFVVRSLLVPSLLALFRREQGRVDASADGE
jgi:putative drug exporter of the RND superfamily